MVNNQNNHKTWWDEKDEIIRLQVFGDYSEQDAENTASKIAEIKQQFLDPEASRQGGSDGASRKLRFLIDLSQATTPSSKARKIIVEKIYKDPALEKIAAITPSVLVRTVNNFLIKASGLGSDKIKMFATEDEALRWLKE